MIIHLNVLIQVLRTAPVRARAPEVAPVRARAPVEAPVIFSGQFLVTVLLYRLVESPMMLVLLAGRAVKFLTIFLFLCQLLMGNPARQMYSGSQ